MGAFPGWLKPKTLLKKPITFYLSHPSKRAWEHYNNFPQLSSPELKLQKQAISNKRLLSNSLTAFILVSPSPPDFGGMGTGMAWDRAEGRQAGHGQEEGQAGLGMARGGMGGHGVALHIYYNALAPSS